MPWYKIWMFNSNDGLFTYRNENITSFKIAEGMALFYDSCNVCILAVPQSRVFEIEVEDYVQEHPQRIERS